MKEQLIYTRVIVLALDPLSEREKNPEKLMSQNL